jgi:hypothetical protein
MMVHSQCCFCEVRDLGFDGRRNHSPKTLTGVVVTCRGMSTVAFYRFVSSKGNFTCYQKGTPDTARRFSERLDRRRTCDIIPNQVRRISEAADRGYAIIFYLVNS